MSYCSICGVTEWNDIIDNVEITYCPKCNPQPVTFLPLDEGNEFDIDESEVIHGMLPQVNSASGVTGAPNTGVQVSNGSSIQFEDVNSGPISLQMEGAQVITAYDELPETADEGQIAFKKGENTAYVFDGEEWQNLGEALRRTKPLKSQDAKCDRRAAIAATKAKNA